MSVRRPEAPADYKTEFRSPKTASAAAKAGPTAAPRAQEPARGLSRAADDDGVDRFLQQLARAVRQFHTYPPGSSFCTDAIEACFQAFEGIDGGRRRRLVFRVAPHELSIDDRGFGAGTIIEQELARRLHRASVAGITIEPDVSAHELAELCRGLIQCRDHSDGAPSLAEVMIERGVEKIEARIVEKPAILEIGAPDMAVSELARHERRRQDSLTVGAAVDHLYPPDKGWVRLDVTSALSSISLPELAILVENPADVAAMLLQLTDEDCDASNERGAVTSPESSAALANATASHDEATARSGAKFDIAREPSRALERKFSDVAMLFASLEPRLAGAMFSKLARAVLALEPDRRAQLLQRTVLPGLLDGHIHGIVLRDFPDLDLADALSLLLDLETAAPEVLTVALNRLDLPADRHQSLVPLLEDRLRAREAAGKAVNPDAPGHRIDRYAQRLIQIDPSHGKSFTDFAAFDLSIDDATAATIARIGESIGATDSREQQLHCVMNLVRLELKQARVEALLQTAIPILIDLEKSSRWHEFVWWLARLRHLSNLMQERRPQVSEALTAALQVFCTRDRATRLIELYEMGPDARGVTRDFIGAVGSGVSAALVSLLEDTGSQSKVGKLMCDHATVLAPALAEHLGRHSSSTRTLVRVLGFAGPGYETVVGQQLAHHDEEIVREALKALARIGTAPAAVLVATQVRDANEVVRGAAEEALWHFPPQLLKAQLRELLARHDFVVQRPETALRLLHRAGQAGADGLERELRELTRLRRRFWSPALVRLAAAARQLLLTS